MDLYVHAQTVDIRRSSPIFQAPGYEAKLKVYSTMTGLEWWAGHSLASHTLYRERAGLVMLQLTSCHWRIQLSNSVVR